MVVSNSAALLSTLFARGAELVYGSVRGDEEAVGPTNSEKFQ